MEKKFKVGDRIHNIQKPNGSNNGGKFGTVSEIKEDMVVVKYDDGTRGQDAPPYDAYELAKPLPPPKFLLVYCLEEDPVEEFQTIAEVKARIKVLWKNPNLVKDSIKVYEIKKMFPVKIENLIRISGI